MKIKNIMPVLAALITISFCSQLVAQAKPLAGSAFYANFWKRFKTTGAITPSSRFLTKAMVRDLAQEAVPGRPLYILDVGAGDGVFTAAIADHLEKKGVDYRLYAVDIDATFYRALKQRFAANKRIKVFQGDILDATSTQVFHLRQGRRFDVIISGLPFYVDFFSAQAVATIFQNYKRLSKQGGLLRWFSYIAAPKMADLQHVYQHTKTTLPVLMRILRDYFAQQPGDKHQKKLDQSRELRDQKSIRLREKCAVIDAFKRDNDVRSSGLILNFPLFARVHECRLYGEADAPSVLRRSQRLKK